MALNIYKNVPNSSYEINFITSESLLITELIRVTQPTFYRHPVRSTVDLVGMRICDPLWGSQHIFVHFRFGNQVPFASEARFGYCL